MFQLVCVQVMFVQKYRKAEWELTFKKTKHISKHFIFQI